MSGPPRKILIVDDEPRILSGLRRRLSSEFAIETAGSGAEALEAIADDSGIAVILADMGRCPE